MDEVEESVSFDSDNAVAVRVAWREQVGHALGNTLRLRELVIRPVREGGDSRVERLDFIRLGFGGGVYWAPMGFPSFQSTSGLRSDRVAQPV